MKCVRNLGLLPPETYADERDRPRQFFDEQGIAVGPRGDSLCHVRCIRIPSHRQAGEFDGIRACSPSSASSSTPGSSAADCIYSGRAVMTKNVLAPCRRWSIRRTSSSLDGSSQCISSITTSSGAVSEIRRTRSHIISKVSDRICGGAILSARLIRHVSHRGNPRGAEARTVRQTATRRGATRSTPGG